MIFIRNHYIRGITITYKIGASEFRNRTCVFLTPNGTFDAFNNYNPPSLL